MVAPLTIGPGIEIGGSINIGPEASLGPSFTITSARLSSAATFGATFSSVTTSGFTIDNPNISNYLYPAYYATITDNDSDIIAAFNTAGETSTQEYPAYIWTVAWGPGSTYTNLAQVGYNSGSKQIYMIPVDPASPWSTPGVSGYSLAGTFTFPATFTAYLPPIAKGGWC
jgi:hypothetical protein